MYFLWFYYFLLIGIVEIKLTTCFCKKSYYVMQCDNFQDVMEQPRMNRSLWTELVIEQGKHFTPHSTLTYKQMEFLDNLKQLVIINELKDVNEFGGPVYYHHYRFPQNLKYIVLYDNNIETLKKEAFLVLRGVEFLNLENNGIKEMHSNSFFNCTIHTLDLSHNQLSTLRSWSLYSSQIEKLIVRHNKLSVIDLNALPAYLKLLNLDFNDFEILREDPFISNDGVSRLEELTLSHNKLTHIADLSQLKNLGKLDISFNRIIAINSVFDNLNNLRVLNLQSNILLEFLFPMFLTQKSYLPFCISLAYNRLTYLNFTTIERPMKVLLLRGNPWDCGCFRLIAEDLRNISFSGENQCETQLLNSGKVPYCINTSIYFSHTSCNRAPLSNEEIGFFQKYAQDNSCDDEDEYTLNNCRLD